MKKVLATVAALGLVLGVSANALALDKPGRASEVESESADKIIKPDKVQSDRDSEKFSANREKLQQLLLLAKEYKNALDAFPTKLLSTEGNQERLEKRINNPMVLGMVRGIINKYPNGSIVAERKNRQEEMEEIRSEFTELVTKIENYQLSDGVGEILELQKTIAEKWGLLGIFNDLGRDFSPKDFSDKKDEGEAPVDEASKKEKFNPQEHETEIKEAFRKIEEMKKKLGEEWAGLNAKINPKLVNMIEGHKKEEDRKRLLQNSLYLLSRFYLQSSTVYLS